MPEDFLSKWQKIKKYFCTGCPKSAVRRCRQYLWREKNSYDIRNQKLEKVKKFKVWVVRRFFLSRGKKPSGRGWIPPPSPSPYRVKINPEKNSRYEYTDNQPKKRQEDGQARKNIW